MDPGDALLHNALDLLEHVGVFLVDPVGEISPIIQDLEQKQARSHPGPAGSHGAAAGMKTLEVSEERNPLENCLGKGRQENNPAPEISECLRMPGKREVQELGQLSAYGNTWNGTQGWCWAQRNNNKKRQKKRKKPKCGFCHSKILPPAGPSGLGKVGSVRTLLDSRENREQMSPRAGEVSRGCTG